MVLSLVQFVFMPNDVSKLMFSILIVIVLLSLLKIKEVGFAVLFLKDEIILNLVDAESHPS
jgi:hypothetical protein